MIYVDTNIFVRMIMRDDHEAARRAFDMVHASPDDSLVLTEVVAHELCYVLANNSRYNMSHYEIATSLREILASPQFRAEKNVAAAVEMFANHSSLDFADCLLAVKANHSRSGVMTFDRPLAAALK
ncbi:MAG: PIN domain-containing protein [Candidatus Saccharimonadales bacterium]